MPAPKGRTRTGELKPAYRNPGAAGYSVAMPAGIGETLVSPTAILWLVVSVMAAAVLFGSINRRRSRLTDSLREFVAKKQGGSASARGREKADD